MLSCFPRSILLSLHLSLLVFLHLFQALLSTLESKKSSWHTELVGLKVKTSCIGMSCPSWHWHRAGYCWLPVQTLLVAPLWCDLGLWSQGQTAVLIKLLQCSSPRFSQRRDIPRLTGTPRLVCDITSEIILPNMITVLTLYTCCLISHEMSYTIVWLNLHFFCIWQWYHIWHHRWDYLSSICMAWATWQHYSTS